jgi:hypothetical protein
MPSWVDKLRNAEKDALKDRVNNTCVGTLGDGYVRRTERYRRCLRPERAACLDMAESGASQTRTRSLTVEETWENRPWDGSRYALRLNNVVLLEEPEEP